MLANIKIKNGEKPNMILNVANTVVSQTPLDSSIVWAKGDSAASSNYWRPQDKHVLTDIETCQGPYVQLPNNEMIASNERGQIPLSNTLSKNAKNAQILPKLASSSLISLGQLCDDDCIIMLHKKVMFAIKNNKIVLQGIRNPIDRLWDIPIHKKIIMDNNYPSPNIHPGIYPSRQTNEIETKNIPKNRKKETTKQKFLQQLSTFGEIIDDNIINNCLMKEAKQLRKQYIKASITPNSPALSR